MKPLVEIKSKIKRFLLKQNLWVSQSSQMKNILDFLDSVKPVRTNHDLIRIGGPSDGGYLIPNDLKGIETCFSPGVSDVADFESDLAERGIKCFMADHSVEAPPVRNPLFDFEKKFLGATDNETYVTLESWIRWKAPSMSDSILQMDIEGGEYPVIFDTSAETLRRFRILVIEFHRLDNLFNPMGCELISLSFQKLLRDFEVVHIHPNNCCGPVQIDEISIPPVMEFTFLRKDRVQRKSLAQVFPHPLDQKNVDAHPDLPLPRCWYAPHS
jgi:hypothetical protein